jgi:hypothetical protein
MEVVPYVVRLPQLRGLDLAQCAGLSDQHVAQVCDKLVRLEVRIWFKCSGERNLNRRSEACMSPEPFLKRAIVYGQSHELKKCAS